MNIAPLKLTLDCSSERSPSDNDTGRDREDLPTNAPDTSAPNNTAPVAVATETIVTPEFEAAFALIERGAPFIFITGKAGTGKSTFIELLKDRLKSYAIVAPTGVAALNIGGQTIHSFFRIAPGPIELDNIKPVKNRIAYKALQTLIIDEISMVRADLLDAIDVMLRRNGRSQHKPFGGVQVISVGDLFQLPPVVSTAEEQLFLLRGYKSPFFFSANSFHANGRLNSVPNSGSNSPESKSPDSNVAHTQSLFESLPLPTSPITTIEFSRVFRQSDESFISILNNIREGKLLAESLNAINCRVCPLKSDSFDGIVLTGTNATASRINNTNLRRTSGDSRTYVGAITGEFRVDKEKLPAPFDLELKPGARVMFVKNDLQKRWVNGTIGTVCELGDNYVNVKIDDRYGERTIRAERETWKNLKYEYNADENAVTAVEVGSYKQIPLALAWAVTIHKSQGKTFDKVHIDLGSGAFAEGQVYVALSRCRTLDGLTLERPIRKQDIHLSWDVIDFYAKQVVGGKQLGT